LQFKAFILALCTLFYLVEYAATPRMMMDMSSRAAATPHCNGDCCHDARQAGAGEHEQCPKPSKGANPAADCCLNCPMCYVTLLPASLAPLEVQPAMRQYGVWQSSYGYLYHASCWKPPNAA
jgi:hypothetical protein